MSLQEPEEITTMDEKQILQKIERLNQASMEISKVIVGQERIITELMISIIAGGHCILEGVPGLAKTLMVSTLAQTLELGFHRVQFTPDLMPSDIIGTEILEEDHVSGKRFFKFQHGPVFTNILLADEINRTPPKTQAALLEAMQERNVSYGGESYALPKPFFVLATQNPVEQAGTYPLPEAQLDRFLMFIRVPYPTESEEIEILNRTTGNIHELPETVLNAEDMIEIQNLVRDVEISPELIAYITRMVRSTRPTESNNEKVRSFVRWGAGPRAGQSLVLCAKAKALLSARFATTLEDIHFVAASVLRHRILLNFQAEAEGLSSDDIVASLLEETPQPTSPIT
jgi:MoxR-like ATPase